MNNTIAVCKVYNITVTNTDGFLCFWAKLSVNAHFYNFGNFCIGILCVVIIISLFGGIKENYRWFILNQAMWDLFVSHAYSCDNNIQNYVKLELPKCIYAPEFLEKVSIIITRIIFINPYSALFLLSTSRFLALYCLNFYERLTKKRMLFFIFLFFNSLIILLSLDNATTLLFLSRVDDLMKQCGGSREICVPKCNADILINIYFILNWTLSYINICIPILSLLFSIFSAIMIILRLIKHSKFQWKNNRRDFFHSARICFVIVLQTAINSFVFSLELFGIFKWILKNVFGIRVLDAIGEYTGTSIRSGFPITRPTIITIEQKTKVTFDFRLPTWLDGKWGLAGQVSLQFITQCRICIEAIIVLLIMSGYREAICKFLKHTFSFLKHPRNSWKKMFIYLNRNKVVSINSFHPSK